MNFTSSVKIQLSNTRPSLSNSVKPTIALTAVTALETVLLKNVVFCVPLISAELVSNARVFLNQAFIVDLRQN